MDPNLIGIVPKQSYSSILEEIVRGRLLKEKNEGTIFFATSLKRKWLKLGCLNPDTEELIIEKLKILFKNELIGIDLMPNAIGNQPLTFQVEDTK